MPNDEPGSVPLLGQGKGDEPALLPADPDYPRLGVVQDPDLSMDSYNYGWVSGRRGMLMGAPVKKAVTW